MKILYLKTLFIKDLNLLLTLNYNGVERLRLIEGNVLLITNLIILNQNVIIRKILLRKETLTSKDPNHYGYQNHYKLVLQEYHLTVKKDHWYLENHFSIHMIGKMWCLLSLQKFGGYAILGNIKNTKVHVSLIKIIFHRLSISDIWKI